jgi:glycosyltransferase involved in cell wall biosynthesis
MDDPVTDRITQRPRSPRPSVTVVIPTCDNPVPLRRAIASVLATEYAPLEIIVVENRPPAASTRSVVEEAFADGIVQYVEEPRRGASFARNAGLTRASGEIIAFTDDDVIVDPTWIERAVSTFSAVQDTACVTGRILPLAADTRSQALFAELTSFDKGSQMQVFRLPESRVLEPLFPYVAGHVGSGANIFIRRDVAFAMGGFDPILGPGTPAVGAEDLDLFIRLAQSGRTIVYDPAVKLQHDNPDGQLELRRHAYKYGMGLTAMLAKHLLHGPARIALLRLIPDGVRYVRNPNSRKNAMKSCNYPASLEWLERIGMLLGPPAYVLSLLASTARSALHGPAVVIRGEPPEPSSAPARSAAVDAHFDTTPEDHRATTPANVAERRGGPPARRAARRPRR